MLTKLTANSRNFSPINEIILKDMGSVWLETDEQITFFTESGKKNDIVKKEWGFYLGNSINWNLKKQGFKTAIVLSEASGEPRIFINLVEVEHIESFFSYLRQYNARVVFWVDELFEGHI